MNKRLNDAIGVPNFTDVMFARHVLGQKQYELTDHLGDVLATISDKRSTDSLTGDTVTTGAVDTVASWKPVVVTATDYYPFGMQMPGRYLSDTSTHCYTTTITEPVDYFNFTYYLFSAYPLPVTPFGGAYLYSLIGGDQQLHTFGHSGDSLVISIDSITPGAVQCLKLVTDGGTNTYGAHIISGGVNVGSSTISYSYGGITTIYFLPTTPTVTLVIGELFSSLLPHAHFDLNLRGLYLPRFDSAVLEDVVTSVCNEDRYHYGFNGQLKDNEIAGVGNHTTALFWEYDTRTGRRWNLDPKDNLYPDLSPYATNHNSPIQFNDPNGDAPGVATIASRVFSFASKFNLVWDIIQGTVSNEPLGLSEINALKSIQENQINRLKLENKKAESEDGEKKASPQTKVKREHTETSRKKWEKANNKEWPSEPDNPNKKQTVSHIRALKDGGNDDANNIEPKPKEEHHEMHKKNGDYSRWRKDAWKAKKEN